MANVFDYYKPLRNYLRQVELIESLSVIRAYVQHLQFSEQIPKDIEVASYVLTAKHWVEKKFYPWELDTLAREIIINSPESNSILFPKTLKRWSYFSDAVNKLKDLENNIAKLYPPKNVLLELYRIAHREFPWQSRPNTIWITRYFKIFGHKELDEIIQRVIGLNLKELYTLGLAITGVYLKHFILFYPPNIQIGSINKGKLDSFLSHFSDNLGPLRENLIKNQEFSENYVYTFNPLRLCPLIRMRIKGKDALICPIPTFLFRRFTEGVYYEICNERDFGEPFGESFQNYVGEVIVKTVSKDSFAIYPEKEYYVGKERKDTTDWIVDGKDAALFIETKTKKLRLRAKVEITTTEVLMEELDKMAEFVVQVYKTIRDYQNNHYPDYKFDPKKEIFPIILTLENWYVFGNQLEDALNAKVKEKFGKYSLDESWLEKMPYSICSVEEFEEMIQIIASIGINNFMRKKVFDLEKKHWAMQSFIFNDFPGELARTKDLFPGVYKEIYPEIERR